jgi:hypothetical protein
MWLLGAPPWYFTFIVLQCYICRAGFKDRHIVKNGKHVEGSGPHRHGKESTTVMVVTSVILRFLISGSSVESLLLALLSEKARSLVADSGYRYYIMARPLQIYGYSRLKINIL